MRAGVRWLAVGCVCGLPLVAAGQDAVCTPGVSIVGGTLGPQLSGTKFSPFSATVKATFEHRLVDGNVIAGEQRTHIAGNSEGWLRQELSNLCRKDAEGKPTRNLMVTVTKGNGESLRWTESERAANVATAYAAPVVKTAMLATPDVATPQQIYKELKQGRAVRPKALLPDITMESLGTAVIAGLEVTGTRTTITYPAGEAGNSLPIASITEFWRTKDGFLAKTVNDDPRTGRTTVEIESMTLGEPDPSLFAPPAGYTVKAATARVALQ